MELGLHTLFDDCINVMIYTITLSVQAAVDKQLKELKLTHPNIKIGLVAFNNDVMVYRNNGHEVITNDKLNNIGKSMNIGMSDTCNINECITDSYERLSNKLWSLESNGQTALGPALAVSIQSGSQVILCKDGLANIGIGKLDEGNSECDVYS